MKVLVIDDTLADLKEIAIAIRGSQSPDGRSYDVTEVSSYEEAMKCTDEKSFDIVVVDMLLGQKSDGGLDIIRHIKQLSNKLPVVIVLTAYANIPNCVEAIKSGAWDYIGKSPVDDIDPYDRLLDSIRKACEHFKKHPERGTPNPDSEWVHDHLDKLMEKYPGKLVAVLYGKVVDSDNSFEELAKHLESRYPLAKPTIVSIPDIRKETH